MDKEKTKEKKEKTDEELEELAKEDVVLEACLEINKVFSGNLEELSKNYARVTLEITDKMKLDKLGLAHSGNIFSSASFAALAAINDPNAIMVSSEVRFLAPVEVGNIITFEAKAIQSETRKREIEVVGTILDIKIFEGTFSVAMFDTHVLKFKIKKVD